MTEKFVPKTSSSNPTISDTRGQLSKTLAYFGAFIAFGLVGAALGPTLPNLAENTQTQLGDIGILFAAFSFGRLMGVFVAGQFYDRTPGHPVMVTMLIILGLMMVLVPLMSLLELLALVLMIAGVCEGSLDVGGNTLLVWVHGRKVGPFMNGLHFSFGVGAFLSPIIIAQAVLITGDITWAFWVLALLMLPVIGALFFLPSPTAPIISEADRSARTNWLLVVLIAVFLFLFVGVEVGFAGWIFSYAVTLELADETVGRYLTSGFFATFTIGRLLAIPIAARFRPRAILFSNLIGCLISLGIILLWSDSAIGLWVGTLGLGLGMASLFPTTLTLAERRIRITGQITSWFLVGASLGAMLLPWLAGQLFDALGPPAVMVSFLIAIAASVGILGVLMAKFGAVDDRPVAATPD